MNRTASHNREWSRLKCQVENRAVKSFGPYKVCTLWQRRPCRVWNGRVFSKRSIRSFLFTSPWTHGISFALAPSWLSFVHPKGPPPHHHLPRLSSQMPPALPKGTIFLLLILPLQSPSTLIWPDFLSAIYKLLVDQSISPARLGTSEQLHHWIMY